MDDGGASDDGEGRRRAAPGVGVDPAAPTESAATPSGKSPGHSHAATAVDTATAAGTAGAKAADVAADAGTRGEYADE